MYTLSGLVNPAHGWGLANDSFTALEMLKRYGEDGWFLLGDGDFATHLLRTKMLKEGYSLTAVTARLAKGLGLECSLLPMANEDVRTKVRTVEAGELPFQEYFVRRRASDTVIGLGFEGVEKASVSPEVRVAIEEASLIIICPSNPYLSVQPILAVPGMSELLKTSPAPIVAVSPIVGGAALKGPAAAIMQSMGGEKEASALGVAKYYAGFAQGFVLDEVDTEQANAIEKMGFKTLVTQTVMKTEADKQRLAAQILEEFLPQ
jgi:LPPG:FO 2-phospho-L-lactate transferase